MASGAKRGGGGGGDVVLESRHLVGLFVMMVVIFGVVFLLGYELGRNQMGGQVRASQAAGEAGAQVTPQPISEPGMQPVVPGTPMQPAGRAPAANRSTTAPPPAKTPATSAKNGTTPSAVSGKAANSPNAAPGKGQGGQASSNTGKSALTSNAGPANSPLIPHGSIVLQVSAMTREVDALREAQELQKKKFPAFVIPPGADRFYHVQVGPYADAKTAEKARAALEQEGFKPIVKH